MTLFFAKTKKAGVICAIIALAMIGVAAFTAYYAVGNYRCAVDSPVLIAESGGAVFLGYYLITAAYSTCCVLAVLLCALFALNAVRAIRK